MSSKMMKPSSNTNPIFDTHMADKLHSLKFTTTEKGADALTNYGLQTKDETPSYVAPLVALTTELVRGNESKKPIKKGEVRDYLGISRKRVSELIYEVFLEIKKFGFTVSHRSEVSKKILSDLVKIMFNIRDIRGTYGKGERRIFLWMMVEINRYLPDLVYWLLTFIPHYGSYKDLADLYELVHTDEMYLQELKRTGNTSGQSSLSSSNLIWEECDKMSKKLNIKTSIVELFAHALEKDLKEFDSKDKTEDINISLAARWVPKEGRALAKLTRTDPKGSVTKRIANKLYPHERDMKATMAKFRRHVSNLNKYLDTVQIKMSSHRFSEIEFDKLPGRATVKFQKAWRGVDKTGKFIHESNTDRVKCCENYMSYLNDLKSGKTAAKGKQLHIHELVNKLQTHLNPDEIDLYNAQFNSHVDDIIQYHKDNGTIVEPYVPMADVSGSMTGDPMSVSIGMAILCSHPGIAHPVWENIVLPFSSNPTLVKLQYPSTQAEWESSKAYSSSTSIYSSSTVLGITFDPSQAGRELTPYEKVKVLRCMDWGQSTNFTGAFGLLADLANRTGTKMPNCLVISDMQFDAAFTCNNRYGSFTQKYNLNTVDSVFKDMNQSIGKPLIKTLNDHLSTKPCGSCKKCVFWNARGGMGNHPCGADDKGVIEVSGFSSNMIKLFFNEGKLESQFSKSNGTSWESLRTMIDCEDYDQLQSFVDLYTDAENELTKTHEDVEFTFMNAELWYIPVFTHFLQCIIRNKATVKLNNKTMERLLTISPSTWAKEKYTVDSTANKPDVSTAQKNSYSIETSTVDYSKINLDEDIPSSNNLTLEKPKLIRATAMGNIGMSSQLSVIEQTIVGKTSDSQTIIQRIIKLEKMLFGKIQTGTALQRINNLYNQVQG